MKLKSKSIAICLTVFAIVAFYSAPTFAAQTIKIPAKVISPRTTVVVYFNADALNIDKVKDTAHVFTDAIPDSDKQLREKLDKAVDKKLDKTNKKIKAAQELQKHIHAALVSVIPPKDSPTTSSMDSDDGKNNSDENKNKGVRALVLLQGDSSTTAKSLTKAFKDANEMAGEKKQEVPEITRYSGNWFLVQEKQDGKVKSSSIVPKDVGDSTTAKKFGSVLNDSKNSAIRIAVVSNETVKKSISKSAKGNGPQAMLADSFKPMQTALITLQFGSSPALDVKINFDNNENSQAANDAITNLLNMFKGMVQMQLPSLKKKMDNPPSSDLINTLFKELSPTTDGSSITFGLHKKFVQNLAKLAPTVDKLAGPMIENKLKDRSGKTGI